MKSHLSFETFKKESLKNPKIKAEYEQLQPEFSLINSLIEARKKAGFTQSQLAKKIGTKQSVISRLEIGRANPTLHFLQKFATALNSHLEIHLT